MAWDTISLPDGNYEVNLEGARSIIHASAYQRAVYNNTRCVRSHELFMGGAVHNVNTNWDRVRLEADRTTREYYDEFILRLSSGGSGRDAQLQLQDLLAQRDSYQSRVNRLRNEASHETMVNLVRWADTGEGDVVPAMKFVRDLSAGTLMIGATILAGTALAGYAAGSALIPLAGSTSAVPTALVATRALGFGVGGSMLKGLARWNDTHSAGQGVVEAGTELVFFTIGGGIGGIKGLSYLSKPAAAGSKWILNIVAAKLKAAVEVAKQSSIPGNSMAKSLSLGGAKLTDPVTGELAKKILGENELWVAPVTAALRYGTKVLFEYLRTRKASEVQPAGSLKTLQPTPITRGFLGSAARPTEFYVEKTIFRPAKNMSGPVSQSKNMCGPNPD